MLMNTIREKFFSVNHNWEGRMGWIDTIQIEIERERERERERTKVEDYVVERDKDNKEKDRIYKRGKIIINLITT